MYVSLYHATVPQLYRQTEGIVDASCCWNQSRRCSGQLYTPLVPSVLCVRCTQWTVVHTDAVPSPQP